MMYDPKKHHRCSANYSVAYTFLKNKKVILSVCQYGIDSLVPKTDGDVAREFAFKKGYIVEYDPKEEIAKAIAFRMENKSISL